MSLPTSETTPDGLLSIPPDRRNRISTAYRDATESERRGFLFALTNRTFCHTEHYTWLLASGVILLFALIFNSHLLLFIAAIVAPLLGPVMSPALSAATPTWSRFWRSLLNLLITLVVYFAAGWLAGMIPRAAGYLTLPHIHLLRSTWLEWLVITAASALTAWLFLRGNEAVRLTSALMTYLIVFPVSLAGMLYQNTLDQAWIATLLIVLARLGASLLTSLIVFWVAGLVPVKVHGWLIAGLTILLALAAIGVFSASKLILTEAPPMAPKSTVPPIETSAASQTQTLTPTPSPLAPTATTVSIIAASVTPTHAATPDAPISASVISTNGVIVRWEPNSKANVVTYLNQNAEITLLGEQQVVGTAVWEKITTTDGEIGWVMARYLATATPKP